MGSLLIIFGAKYLVAIPFVALFVYFLFAPGKISRRLLWLSAFGLPLAYVVAKLFNHFFYNARPFVVGNFTPLVEHVADNGFPSDHTVFAATVASLLFCVDKRVGSALWVVTLLIALSRVLAGVHHTLDVVGSMVIAVCAVYVAHYIVKRLHVYREGH